MTYNVFGGTLNLTQSINPDDITSALSLTVMKTENTFSSTVLSGRYYVACLWLFSPYGGPNSYLLRPC